MGANDSHLQARLPTAEQSNQQGSVLGCRGGLAKCELMVIGKVRAKKPLQKWVLLKSGGGSSFSET